MMDLTTTIEAALALGATWHTSPPRSRNAIHHRFCRSELTRDDMRDLAVMLERAALKLRAAADHGQALYQVRIKGISTADCIEGRHDQCSCAPSTDPSLPCVCPCHGQWGEDAQQDVLAADRRAAKADLAAQAHARFEHWGEKMRDAQDEGNTQRAEKCARKMRFWALRHRNLTQTAETAPKTRAEAQAREQPDLSALREP